jgi:glucokinase
MIDRQEKSGLVGDIGGTNARFAFAHVLSDGTIRIEQVVSMAARDYPGPEQAIAAFLSTSVTRHLDFAGIACAGPIAQGKVSFTNLDWKADAQQLGRMLGIDRVRLLNDLEAHGWAVPVLLGPDLAGIGGSFDKPATPDAGPIAVFGVGTGTNVSLHLTDDHGHEQVIVGEGGHIGFAPHDEIDLAIWQQLARRFGRVSIERLASGPGLLNIYEALCALDGSMVECDSPPAVVTAAQKANRIAVQALERFCLILGTIAGDFALAFGARGGVYISGGIAPLLIDALNTGGFRQRFESKGRFEAYMAAIPTCVIVHPSSALLGAARAAIKAGDVY